MRLFKLKFYSALHVDSKGSGEPETLEEFIRSDTLSGALCLAWTAVRPEADDNFFLIPPFTVSSAFPFVGDTLLFPSPVWNIWKEMDISERKRIKGIRWISKALFEQVLAGKSVDPGQVILPCGIAVSKDEVEANGKLKESQAWIISERQRVSVDRLGMPTTGGLFFFALQFFNVASGLYFIANVESKEITKFRAALDYLGDSGIGADRNSGLGHFTVSGEAELDLEFPKQSEGWINLSLFNPGPDEKMEDLIKNSAYGLTTRAGWISNSTIGRPPVRVFTEGSFFSTKPAGRVVPMIDEKIKKQFNLKIPHSAPRDFRTISLRCAKPSHMKE